MHNLMQFSDIGQNVLSENEQVLIRNIKLLTIIILLVASWDSF